MSFHTKYRPQAFKDVLGQNHIISSLKRVSKDARAKSFIFSGPSGTGKTTLARILANTLAGGIATAANIEEIDAVLKSGADDMRAVVARTHYRAVGPSPIKAVVVDECHRLSGTAWDTLLKPTEEPPKHVYWMFCSTNPAKIPPTIKTRSLRYELKLVSEELIYGLLEKVAVAEKLDVNEEVLEAIAEDAGGSPRQALVYLEACLDCSTAAEAHRVMRSAGQSREAVDLARWLVEGRNQTWAEAMKFVKAMETTTEAESIRITIVNYMSKVLMNTQNDIKARKLLGVMEVFETPYNTSDRMAPLLLSLGLALGLGK